MKKKLFTTLLVILLAAFFILAAKQPDHFSVSRSVMMKASPQAIFPEIIDFINWKEWSPWFQEAEDLRIPGQSVGVGATMVWSEGEVTITESKPNELIQLMFTFSGALPLPSKVQSVFNIDSGAEGSQVHWTMGGVNSFKDKMLGVFINKESFIGDDLAQALNSLKQRVEMRAP